MDIWAVCGTNAWGMRTKQTKNSTILSIENNGVGFWSWKFIYQFYEHTPAATDVDHPSCWDTPSRMPIFSHFRTHTSPTLLVYTHNYFKPNFYLPRLFFFLHLHKILIPATELPAGLRIALSAKSCQGAEVMLHMGGRLGPQGDSPEQLWLPPSAS